MNTGDKLVQRAVSGDAHALELLLLDHHDRLTSQLRRRLPDALRRTVSVQDIVQETYIRAFRHITTFEPQGDDAFARWLSTIGRRCLADAIRHERAQKRGAGGDATESVVRLLALVSARDKSPSRIAAQRESMQAMRVALAGLKEDYRLAIELRYIQGLTVAQTAARMKRTDRAVHMLCHRALKKLEASLGRASQFFSTKS